VLEAIEMHKWSGPAHHHQQHEYRDRTIEAFFLAGNGGQIVMGIPELDLAMAFYGGSYSDHKGTYLAQDDYVPHFILPAVN